MVTTVEIALAQKMHEALTAYGLAPNEAAAEIRLKISLPPGDHSDVFHSDSLYINIGGRRVNDAARNKEVRAVLKQFMEDFIIATGIDPHSEHCSNAGKGVYIIGTNDSGMPRFYCKDVANSSTRQGRDRAVDDVWYGLDNMIKAKQQQQSWAKRA